MSVCLSVGRSNTSFNTFKKWQNCYNVTMLQCYNVTMLQCYNVAMLQRRNVTIPPFHTVTMSHYYNITNNIIFEHTKTWVKPTNRQTDRPTWWHIELLLQLKIKINENKLLKISLFHEAGEKVCEYNGPLSPATGKTQNQPGHNIMSSKH